MRPIAKAISIVFHPILMPLACMVVATRFDWHIFAMMHPEQMYLLYVVVALSCIAFPVLNLILLRVYGFITSVEIEKRQERLAPFVSTIFFFCLGYYLLRKGFLPTPIYSIYLGCILAIALITVISTLWKISAHAAGVAGLLGCTLGLFRLHEFGNITLLVVILLVAGMVLSARLALNAHTPRQVYYGAGLGFLSVYVPIVGRWFI